MPTRRTFLRTTVGLVTASAFTRVLAADAPALPEGFKGADILDRVLAKAIDGKWSSLPIGQVIAHVARELDGTPQADYSLERSPDREVCVVNLAGFDGVTFVETALCLARMIKKGGRTPRDLVDEVTLTRYRAGHLADYTSRLHYFSDWITDNDRKRVVRNITPDLPDAADFTQKVGVMSSRPKFYRQLVAHPELIPRIKEIEQAINARKLKYVPMDKLPAAEPHLQTGDIVAITCDYPGFDILFPAIVIVNDAGVPCVVRTAANLKPARVRLETTSVTQTFNTSRHNTGAMVARPLEPRA